MTDKNFGFNWLHTVAATKIFLKVVDSKQKPPHKKTTKNLANNKNKQNLNFTNMRCNYWYVSACLPFTVPCMLFFQFFWGVSYPDSPIYHCNFYF